MAFIGPSDLPDAAIAQGIAFKAFGLGHLDPLHEEVVFDQFRPEGSRELCIGLKIIHRFGQRRGDAKVRLGVALDLCSALPLGVPKYVVSTVSFNPMLPPERIPANFPTILWAGGLYGLNSICKASLSQAAGALLGAARAVEPPAATSR